MEYVPAPHKTHVPMPASRLKVPAEHAPHSSPFEDAKYPGSHSQADRSTDPATEEVCKGHSLHARVPLDALYVPVGHSAQATSFWLAV